MRVQTSILVFLSLFFSSPSFSQSADPIVALQTTRGPIIIRVYRTAVPFTSMNFLDLVSRGFYNGLTFHRVETWCIQGGDPTGTGNGSFVDPQTGRARYLNLEVNRNLRHNSAGVVAMARSNDPNSASCQFYITKSAQPMLDGKYAIFGHVMDGINTVNNISVGDRILSAQIVQGGGGVPAQSIGSGSSIRFQPSAASQGRYNSNLHSNAGTPTDSGF